MAYHHSNGGGEGGIGNSGASGINIDNSADERESRNGIEERPDNDMHDKPTYLLEHLATFTVNKDSGIVYPADGMRRLLQLEKTTGIWSQKMQLCLDYQWVLIMDYETENIIERFPATLIQEPTAFTSSDAMELYNNILVFIVSGGNSSRSEMHIFQSQSVSAVHLVEDLKNLRNGKMVTQQRQTSQQLHQMNSTSSGYNKSAMVQGQTDNEQHNYHHHHQHSHQKTITGNNETDSENGVGGLNDETSSTSSDKYERDVAVLNHCFDDIEKFIARLQHAAAASRELERRRRNRKTKKKDPGEGLLTLRTRPPHEKEYIDIFAKFKLSFNLLAKLKAHIHDPNAPELVHFLFTPLALIVEAASDTYYDLPGNVIHPLLTREAINLLINCVTSKETELWRSLGDAWVLPRDLWKDDVVGIAYHPVFLDGWSPDYLVIDELESSSTTTANVNKRRFDIQPGRQNSLESGAVVGYNNYDNNTPIHSDGNKKYSLRHSNYDTNGRSERPGITNDFGTHSEISIDSIERSGLTAGIQNLHTRSIEPEEGAYGVEKITDGIGRVIGSRITDDNLSGGGVPNIRDDSAQSELNIGRHTIGGTGAHLSGNQSNDEQLLESWLDDLQASGSKIVLVTYPRTANNDKELSVVRGEYLEVLDDTRKWWKARNIRGQIAHVPHTIVTPYFYGNASGDTNNHFYGQQQQKQKIYKSTSKQISNTNSGNNSEAITTPDSADWIRNKQLGLKESLMINNTNNTNIKNTENYAMNGAMQEELKNVLRKRNDLEIQKTPAVYIDENSNSKDVLHWLKMKNFSDFVIRQSNGLTGKELFAIPPLRIEQLFGMEGRRLASQIKLQKSVSGFKTGKSSELQAVLSRSRPKSEL